MMNLIRIMDKKFHSEFAKTTVFINRKSAETFLIEKRGHIRVRVRDLIYKLGGDVKQNLKLFTKYELGVAFLYKHDDELLTLLSDISCLVEHRRTLKSNDELAKVFSTYTSGVFRSNFHREFSVGYRITKYLGNLMKEDLGIELYNSNSINI